MSLAARGGNSSAQPITTGSDSTKKDVTIDRIVIGLAGSPNVVSSITMNERHMCNSHRFQSLLGPPNRNSIDSCDG